MEEIIEWLAGIEKRAWVLYEQASLKFQDDPGLAGLLKDLAEDERLHYEVISKATALGDAAPFTPLMSLDRQMSEELMRRLKELEDKISAGSLSVEELVRQAIVLEFSELNAIFLYAIESLRKTSGDDFRKVALNMEVHKGRLNDFIKTRPELSGLAKMARALPSAVNAKILVVDDKSVNVNLLKAVLENEGEVYTAVNGLEALEKVEENFFSAIVTDVEMPVMDGVEFYCKAVERFPKIGKRFVFFTASCDSNRLALLKEMRVKCLKKPAPISDIRNTVREAMH